ncbi:SMI1/KNR4 family protein [Chryseobacterium aquaticum]|uniref:SMI1/KNR4 family protein n=1 Tax=Chryseobacterium aquaticum TaxID=452084 RepID=UPI002FC58AFA
MEIIYLKKLKSSSSIGGRVIQGMQENEINTIEKKLKIKFPKAYKEFIFLAGKYSGGLPLMDTSDIYMIFQLIGTKKYNKKSWLEPE